MNIGDAVVLTAEVGLLAGLGWFFFGPRPARAARIEDGVQRLEITVRGGYSPDVIRVRQGVPAEFVFDRQEPGDCILYAADALATGFLLFTRRDA